MSDGLLMRLQESTYDPLTRECLGLDDSAHISVADVCSARSRLEEAAADLIAKDAEIARLRGLMKDAEELTDAAIDPRYGSKEDWDWREDVLTRIRAELARDGTP